MSGTTQVALITAAIGVAGAVLVALLTARLQRRNAMRAAHGPAVAAARLINREMEQNYVHAQTAFEAGHDEASFSTAAWDEHKAAVSGHLTEEELLVLDRYYALVKLGPTSGVLALYSTASQAIVWLARGSQNVTKPRKTETSLAPANMNLPCQCGHNFAHHGWRAVRRRVRIRNRHAKFKDVGFECKQCDCVRFRGVGRLDYR